jgi:hypothetical protein
MTINFKYKASVPDRLKNVLAYHQSQKFKLACQGIQINLVSMKVLELQTSVMMSVHLESLLEIL